MTNNEVRKVWGFNVAGPWVFRPLVVFRLAFCSGRACAHVNTFDGKISSDREIQIIATCLWVAPLAENLPIKCSFGPRGKVGPNSETDHGESDPNH